MRTLIIGLLLAPALVYAQASGTGSFKRSGGEAVSIEAAGSNGADLRGAQAQTGGIPWGHNAEADLKARRDREYNLRAREIEIKEAAAKQEQRKADQEFRAREAQINRQQGQR